MTRAQRANWTKARERVLALELKRLEQSPRDGHAAWRVRTLKRLLGGR